MNSWACCDDEPRYPDDERVARVAEQAVRLALVMQRHGVPVDTIVQVVTDYLTPDR